MKKFIQDDFLLSKKEIEYVNNTILAPNFEWYYKDESNKGDGHWFYSHLVVQRVELGGGYTSKISSFCESLLKKFCKKHKIKYEKILRCCVNTTFFQKNKSFMHNDHDCDYNHLFIYLTTNKSGETILFKEDKKTIIKKIKPKQFRAVSFPKCWHIGNPPVDATRKILIVYTFK
tara:strand:- start:3202 stop:3723 length:522 start_codon:yes stop_codon:yes gene_type:complete